MRKKQRTLSAGGNVKRKFLSAVIYATTAFALAESFDSLYGAGPVTHELGLIHLAIAGTILFTVACILSLFTLRAAVVCGLAGGVLSWPYFAIPIPTIPWGSLVSILPYANWMALLTTLLALVVSSVYSVNQLRILLRGRIDSEASQMKLKLLAAVLYAAGIFCLANWYSIWHWFRLRNRS
jgi:heme exporter protein D